ncbi:acyl-CoA dehydrogenase family protein [Verticiella sediminum]|nr:acyl-CoA dehydrogenase family protein [Verticiella sediminum]
MPLMGRPAFAMPLAQVHDAVPPWVAASADALDQGVHTNTSARPTDVLPRLAEAGYLGLGIPRAAGGQGGDITDALAAVVALATQSLTVAFVYWAQRGSLEIVASSPQAQAREARLPALLSGARAGAPGLSNAMKSLGGLEPMRVQASRDDGGWRLDGRVPWTTNARPAGFSVMLGATRPDGGVAVFAVDGPSTGLRAEPQGHLIGLRGSHTAALALQAVAANAHAVLHEDLASALPAFRPAFIGLQCGLSLGLASACIAAARAAGPLAGAVAQGLDACERELGSLYDELLAGLRSGAYATGPAALFRVRIALAYQVRQAAWLELQAGGSRAYQEVNGTGFARRWREAAFIPIITPTLAQLESQLAALR